MITPFEDPGDQTGSGAKRESQRCPETVDMFAPLAAHMEERQGLFDAEHDGVTYEPGIDKARLNAQTQRVYAATKDGSWRTLRYLSDITGDPEASVSARLRDLRKDKFGGLTVERRRATSLAGTYQYRVVI